MKINNIIKNLRKETGSVALSGITDPYKVLVSTIISQRLRDETTERVSRELFKYYKTPKKMSEAKLSDLRRILKSSGFYKNKAKNIKNTSKIIYQEYGGRVPDSMEELVKLPGVGRKTAGCVLVYAFGKDAIPVDTHVHRVSNRTGLVKTKTPNQTEKELMRVLPKKYWRELNYLFVVHGKNTCKPISPLCYKCSIRKECKYTYKNLKKEIG